MARIEGDRTADRYGTAAGKCFLDMLGVCAEFETNLRKERPLEGIAKVKAAGVYRGRQPSIDPARVRELKAQGRQGAPYRSGERVSCLGSQRLSAGLFL